MTVENIIFGGIMLFIGMLIGTFIVDPLAKYMMKEAKKKKIKNLRMKV